MKNLIRHMERGSVRYALHKVIFFLMITTEGFCFFFVVFLYFLGFGRGGLFGAALLGRRVPCVATVLILFESLEIQAFLVILVIF